MLISKYLSVHCQTQISLLPRQPSGHRRANSGTRRRAGRSPLIKCKRRAMRRATQNSTMSRIVSNQVNSTFCQNDTEISKKMLYNILHLLQFVAFVPGPGTLTVQQLLVLHSSLVDYLAQVIYAKNCPTTFYCIFQLVWVPMTTAQNIRVCFLSS